MERSKLGCETLKIDQACLTVTSLVKEHLNVLWQSDECYECDLVEISKEPLRIHSNLSFNLDTRFSSQLKLHQANENGNQSCLLNFHLIDTGKYFITVTKNLTDCMEDEQNCLLCEMKSDAPSELNTYLPIIYAFVGYLAIALFWILINILYNRGYLQRFLRRKSDDFSMSTIALDPPPQPGIGNSSIQGSTPPKRRLKSLDTFRGISIAIMIFSNYGGGKYWFFHHSKWNGLTVADLVFPWFIWIMGVSMALSMRSLVKREVPRGKIFFKIIKRSVILFSLGIILNTYGGYNDLSKLRIPGVLQRFAISYFVVATVHMFCANPDETIFSSSYLKLKTWIEWIIMLALLTIHIVITFTVSEEGCPKGYLGPGGLHDHKMYENCTGGASGYIDRLVLGGNHIYKNPTPKEIYKTSQPYDPEGILGCLTSIFLVFMGLQAGKILLAYKGNKERVFRWLAWSLITGVIAIILCKASKNDGWIPVNKNLWSVSYIFTMGSMSFFLLSICYYIQDIKIWWSGAPFFYAGMNSIVLYLGHELTGSLFPWNWATEVSHSAYLGVNLFGCSLWVLISYALFKKKVFLSI